MGTKWKTISNWLKQFFCFHKWVDSSREVFDVVNSNNRVVGCVEIVCVKCVNCGKTDFFIYRKDKFNKKQ